MERYVIGIDVGGTKVAYGLFDQDRALLDSCRHPSNREAEGAAFSDELAATIRTLLDRNGATLAQLEGVGLCLPSVIQYDTGTILFTANLSRLNGFAICDYLSKALEGVPVRLDNDGNAAALAEYAYGAGRGCRNMLYVAISTGLGLGIIINGQVFRGDNGWAGESGHIIANPEQTKEDYESHVSGINITKRLAERMRGGQESLLSQLCGGDLDALSAKHLLEAYQQGDELARWGVDHMAHYLGVWAYNHYLALNINRFVFGGGLVHFGDALLGQARRKMDELGKAKGFDTAGVEFRTAEMVDNFGIVGAAELFFQ